MDRRSGWGRREKGGNESMVAMVFTGDDYYGWATWHGLGRVKK